MRVNGSLRHLSDHYGSYDCLRNKGKKISFNDCLICNEKSKNQT